jgi:hypothetical protein
VTPIERRALHDAYTAPERDARVQGRDYRTAANLRRNGMIDSLYRITIAGMRADPLLGAELDALHEAAAAENGTR